MALMRDAIFHSEGFDPSSQMSPCAETRNQSLVAPRQRTQEPTYMSGSVIGLCYENGVLLAADMGATTRFTRIPHQPRILKINENTMIGVSGDFADFQYLEKIIEAKMIDEERKNEGFQMKPRSLYVYLSRLLYQRRNNFNPLWTNIIVTGMQDGKPFMGVVDMIGTAFETNLYSTGFGNYLGMGVMREAVEKHDGKLPLQAAVEALQSVLRVLYYRNTAAFPDYQIGNCTASGVKIEGPMRIDSEWEIAKH
ncbi:proteasome subunit beta type-4 [Galendromus occidentalis]|uniref:Proteasome subunit beta n=1 Tax=Galendromus occidentalis TaxID=34638 RepID=A0AAJ6QPH0_9ACAR|nr:proteasome subunit beta type-4 [Galendromus occidentalis]